jgi:hypothetical protein
LKSTFHLHYGKSDPAATKYRDPLYDEKRLWVSRLLAQFMHEEALIVSVDESNIRSDKLGGKCWKFNPRALRRERAATQSQLCKKFGRSANLFNTHAKLLELGDTSSEEVEEDLLPFKSTGSRTGKTLIARSGTVLPKRTIISRDKAQG